MFKVGDMAVYPTHGVGIIESIESKEISGNKHTFYVLRVLGNGMTIMIPTNNAEAVGLRQIISHKQVSKVYKILRRKNIEIDAQTWNRRYREYIEKIKNLNLARELSGIFEFNSKEAFFVRLMEACYNVCKPLIGDMELELLLINNEGEILVL